MDNQLASKIRLELVIIGDELLAGDLQDANMKYLVAKLLQIGLPISQVTFAPDDEEQLQKVLREALSRSQLVIACGGLGPTDDDISRKVAAKIFKRKLLENPQLLQVIKKRLLKMGVTPNELSIRQAEIPEGANLIYNPTGLAPGIILSEQDKILVLLPGVPLELKAILDEGLLDYLKTKFPAVSSFRRILRTVGVTETDLALRVGHLLRRYPDLKLSYLPKLARVDLRISGASQEQLDKAVDECKLLLGNDLYSATEDDIFKVVLQMLIEQGYSLAVAESCTGGMLASSIVDVPGSSSCFHGGVIAYSNSVKHELLSVPVDLINTVGAVSSQVAERMAQGVRELFNSTWGIGITGIAGPGGASAEKPVGLVYISVANAVSSKVIQMVFPATRFAIRKRSVILAIDLLRREILKEY